MFFSANISIMSVPTKQIDRKSLGSRTILLSSTPLFAFTTPIALGGTSSKGGTSAHLYIIIYMYQPTHECDDTCVRSLMTS